MRRAYIEAHEPLRQAFNTARRWAGNATTSLLAPSTRAVEAQPWLEQSGVPIGTTSNRHTRFNAPPGRTVIAWCLHLDELLDLEQRTRPEGVVLVQASAQHAPWTTAFDVEHIGGEPIDPISEPPAPIQATVRGLTGIAVTNQGLVDNRERHAAIQALTYLRNHDHVLDPDQIATAALREGWPGRSPLELAQIARDQNRGQRLRWNPRISEDALARWAAGELD